MATADQKRKSAVDKTAPLTALDIERIRRDFPTLHIERDGKPLVYLDNAATSHKPEAVIERIVQYYRSENSNVHRGMHYLSEIATEAYEQSRKKIQRFLGVPLSCEVIFTGGTTEGINMVAQTYGRKNVGSGDEVIISAMEHHSNIVPWQMLCEEKGANLRVIPMNDRGELLLDEFKNLLTGKTKLVAVNHVSNVLGTINPVREIITIAHEHGVPVLVDGAQAVPHLPVNVKEMDCDFYACSAHKMVGPTGMGVVYGKAELLNEMPPFMGGGDMILSVTFEKTTYSTLPYKFEAGTPNIAGVIGMGAAVDYLDAIGMDRIAAYEHELTRYGIELLESIDGVRIVGNAQERSGVLSFTLENAHPHDIGQIFSDCGIAIRAGHHCAQPVMQRFCIPATARASLAFYNTKEDLDAMADAIKRVKEVFD